MRFSTIKKKQGIGAELRADMRVTTLFLFFSLLAALVVVHLFDLQVLKYDFYYALASDQHDFFQKLFPERGQIFEQDRLLVNGESKDNVYPVAINKQYVLVYAQPKYITDPTAAANAIAPILSMPADQLLAKLAKPDDQYEPIAHKVEQSVAERVKELGIEGIRFAPETFRYYPEAAIGAHVLGFVSLSDDAKKGVYGIEGHMDTELRGVAGESLAERDSFGNLIGFGQKDAITAQDGSDIVLTIDKTVQSYICTTLSQTAKDLGAKSGTIIVMDPHTGAVRAMCSYPEFDPNEYNKVDDIRAYNNTAIYGAYEPGSIFKPITMSAGIDVGAITPETTYVDEGQVKVDDKTIRNATRQGYGLQTMTQVLEKSLNTGTVFAMRQMGPDVLRDYIKRYDFGKPTGIELDSESRGNIATLDKRGEIFAATASFGQGITATPLQMLAAIDVMANGGRQVHPYIVAEIRKSDGQIIEHQPVETKQIIQEKTATLVAGMMVSVIEHAKHAHVPGYYIAGKSGTAQIADTNGSYSENRTNHTMIGFGPAENPQFSLIIKYEEPQKGQFAESTAGPVFAQVVKFLLEYYHIAPSH